MRIFVVLHDSGPEVDRLPRESRLCSGVERHAPEERFASRRSVKAKNGGSEEDEEHEKCRFRVPSRKMHGQKIAVQNGIRTKSYHKCKEPEPN